MRSESSLLSQPIAVGRQGLNLLAAVVFTLVNAVRWLLFDSWRKRREEVRRVRPGGVRATAAAAASAAARSLAVAPRMRRGSLRTR